MRTKNKVWIGLICVVVLVSSSTVYFSDFKKVFADAVNENPDLTYLVYSHFLEGKDKIDQVGVLVPNLLTKSIYDFERYKLDKEQGTYYSNGYNVSLEWKWFYEYYKIYGIDEWIQLNRKPSLIELNYFPKFNELFVDVKKKTPYYATESVSGNGGILYEILQVNQDRHKLIIKLEVEGTDRAKSKNRLIWQIKGLEDLNVPVGVEIRNLIKLYLPGRFISWEDAKEQFDYLIKLENGLVKIYFKPVVGNQEIDPSIGKSPAVNDFINLKWTGCNAENKDFNLYLQAFHCNSIYSFSNPLKKEINLADWSFSEQKLADSLEFQERKFYVRAEEIYLDENIPVYREKLDLNGSVSKEVIEWNASYKSRVFWKEIELKDVLLESNESKLIRVKGIFKPGLGKQIKYDSIPKTVFNGSEIELKEYALWDSNTSYTARNLISYRSPADYNILQGLAWMFHLGDFNSSYSYASECEFVVYDENASKEMKLFDMPDIGTSDVNLLAELNWLPAGTDFNSLYLYHDPNRICITDWNNTNTINWPYGLDAYTKHLIHLDKEDANSQVVIDSVDVNAENGRWAGVIKWDSVNMKFGDYSAGTFSLSAGAEATGNIEFSKGFWGGQTSGTVEFWFMETTLCSAGDCKILSSGTNGQLIAMDTRPYTSFPSSTGTKNWIQDLNVWHHMAVDWNTTNLRIFIDGNRWHIEADTGAAGSSNSNWSFGDAIWTSWDFTGNLDEVRFSTIARPEYLYIGSPILFDIRAEETPGIRDFNHSFQPDLNFFRFLVDVDTNDNIPIGQNDVNGIFRVDNNSSGMLNVNVWMDFNAIPGGWTVVCGADKNRAIGSWDINASSRALITNLVAPLDSNMIWCWADVNASPQSGAGFGELRFFTTGSG